MNKWMALRHLLVSPVAFVGLFFFCFYYIFRNSRYGDSKLFMAIPAVVFGLPSGIINLIFNWVFATFIFWELPPFEDPFFTTRLKDRLRRGDDDPTTRWYVWAVGDNPYE